MSIHPDLLTILACPKCKGGLELLDREEGLRCGACGLVYPVREELPVMLVAEAVPVANWEQGVRENKA